MKEIAILDSTSGSVSIHTLPISVQNGTDNDLQDHIHLTLEVDSNSDYIVADKIVLSDFRNK